MHSAFEGAYAIVSQADRTFPAWVGLSTCSAASFIRGRGAAALSQVHITRNRSPLFLSEGDVNDVYELSPCRKRRCGVMEALSESFLLNNRQLLYTVFTDNLRNHVKSKRIIAIWIYNVNNTIVLVLNLSLIIVM